MFDNYFTQDLKEGEEEVTIIRKYWASFLPAILKAFFIIIIPLLLAPFLFDSIWGLLIFVIWLCIGLAYFIYQWFNWYFGIFIVTNQRIISISQNGIFSRSVSEINLSSIQDINYEINGFLATALNYGTVRIQALKSNSEIVINDVLNPKSIQDVIIKLAKSAKKEMSAKELIEFITEAKSKLKNKEKE